MSLQEYKRKRHFNRTPEPEGGHKSSDTGHLFVVQKHAASRLHYDFRLELDGTLKSWAVPKGPSLDPGVKALAVQVEDHPLDYADFEGVIAKGEYGGGTVMVWDQGSWQPEGEHPSRDFAKGKLKFQLHGEKLRGAWSLVRMGGKRNEDGTNWLLIKSDDMYARPNAKRDFLAHYSRSVLSGRTLNEISADSDPISARGASSDPGRSGTHRRTTARPTSNSAANPRLRSGKTSPNGQTDEKNLETIRKLAAAATGVRKAKQPTHFKPQLATLSATAPQGDQWLHELKFDGYRLIAMCHDGRVQLITRQGNDWTDRFPTIARELRKLPSSNCILDGEVVSLDRHGISNFQELQNTLKRGTADTLVYYVFDLPHFEKWDLTGAPLVERKAVLADLLASVSASNDGPVRYSDHIVGQGGKVWQHACRGSMEGIIAKRADSRYEQSRSRNWLKVKCLKRQEFVIGGFTKPSGSRTGFGALLLGVYEEGELRFAGRVGTGFTEQSLSDLAKKLNSRVVKDPPFADPPRGAQGRGVTWVRPDLVGEVAFTEWTEEGSLRHPSFQGLREDKLAREVTREVAQLPANGEGALTLSTDPKTNKQEVGKVTANGATVAGITISSPDRVVYKEQGVTKLALARYYEQVADWILPHLENRPLTLVRCPKGASGSCFYQKHYTESIPKGVHAVTIQEKDSPEDYLVIDDLKGLVSLVQIGVLELHPWPARTDAVERPDRLVFDLDPGEGVEWKQVVEGAREVGQLLEQLGLQPFLRTTGGKGLHVVVPLTRRNSWDEAKEFARRVAMCMTRQAPDRYIATMSKAKRVGKVFIDYLRNQRGATAIASFSTRARRGAPIAAPIAWSELTTRLKPDAFNVTNVIQRLEGLESDPWEGFFHVRQSLTRGMFAQLEK